MATFTVDEDTQQPAHVAGRERAALNAPVNAVPMPTGHHREDGHGNRLAVQALHGIKRVHFGKVTHRAPWCMSFRRLLLCF